MSLPLTDEIKREIATMAKNLPQVSTGKGVPMFTRKYGYVLIEELTAKGQKPPFVIKIAGRDVKIKPNKTYDLQVSTSELYNHQFELEKMWRLGGHPACLEYIRKMKQLAAKPAAPEKPNPKEEYGEVKESMTFNKDGSVTYNVPATFGNASIKDNKNQSNSPL